VTTEADRSGTKAATQDIVDGARDSLVDLSHAIHARPELAFEEHEASRRVADVLAAGGFDVDFGVCDLDTAFVATAGSGELTIAVCAEYDALPGIGHACGHNIIAAAAAGAGLGLASIADDLGITVKVMGTPAEEGGGGKILMLEAGAFDGVHASMMVHPAPRESPQMNCLAVSHFSVHYAGKSSHASAAPQRGFNAADALTVAQVSIGLLRQHLRPTDRVHGIVTKGGDAPNIIPEETSGRWYVRTTKLQYLEKLEARVVKCFEAGALATGCTLEVKPESPHYSEFRPDEELVALFRRNAEALGRAYPDRTEEEALSAGSTDMANLSLAMPAIHPMLGLDSLPAVNHQPEFTAHCVTPVADRAVRDGALAMTWTTIDMATDPILRARLLVPRT
jgi:amidohydrolase